MQKLEGILSEEGICLRIDQNILAEGDLGELKTDCKE